MLRLPPEVACSTMQVFNESRSKLESYLVDIGKGDYLKKPELINEHFRYDFVN